MYMKNPLTKPMKPRVLSTSIAIALGLTLPVITATQSFAQEKLEEITVTGSRIVRRDYEASSPIVTINQESFNQVSNLGIENALNQLPQFVPSQTQFSSGDVQSSSFNTPGIATLNLRGLGANRNLVLIDGRRAQPSNALLVVDVNTIPSAAIESVEVISGGASATYGADAMGGVTNFKLKHNFEGFNLNVQTSNTEQGGGQETRISGLIGGRFGNNGNVMLGLEGAERQAIMSVDRDFTQAGLADAGTPGGNSLKFSSYKPAAGPTGGNPSQTALDAIFGPGVAAPSDTFYINPDNTIFINSAKSGAAHYTGPLNNEFKILKGIANAGTLSENNLDGIISTPLKRYSIFARANYGFSDKMRAFLQASSTHSSVDTVLNYAPALSQWNATIPRDGRALPAQLNALLDARPNPAAPWNLERGSVDFVGPRRTKNGSDVFQVMAGLEGDIGNTTWTYEAYASHGQTSLLAELNGFPTLNAWRALVTAPNFGKNYNQGSGPPLGFARKCTTGLPIFGTFTPSADCVDALNSQMKHLTEISQDIMEVNIQGEIFKLPAGTLQGAFGASTRSNSFRFRPDSLLSSTSDNYPIGLFSTSPTTGDTKVNEFYGELRVPVLKGIKGIKEFNLELGARYSDFDTAGGIWTYKGLIDWSVNDDLRIRGGYQLANRAPNAAELYTGPSQAVVGFAGGDPCLTNTTNTWGNLPSNPNQAKVVALCKQIIEKSGYTNTPYHTNPNAIVGPFPFNFPLEIGIISGNPKLNNEEAKTYTLGFVLKSPFTGLFEKASLSVDWYQINIKDAIAPTDSWSVYAKCFNQDGSNPSYAYNEFCGLIARDQDGYRASVLTPYYNLGGIETAGVDVQFNWGFDALGGRFNLNTVVNFLDYFRDQQTTKDPFVDRTNTLSGIGGAAGGQYDYRIFTTLNYMRDTWSIGLKHNFLPAIHSGAYATNSATTVEGAGSYSNFSAFGSYTLTKAISLRGGIDNLFNTDPEIVGRQAGVTNAMGATSGGFYDPIGRRYYVAVEMNF